MDTAAAIPKWWDSTGNSGSGAWRDFSYNTTGGVNTTYTYAVPASTTKLRLTGSDSTTNDVEIFGGTGGLTVARTNANKLTINGGQYTVGIAAPTTAVTGKNVSIKLELNGTALDEVGIQGTTYISNAVVNAGTFSLGLSAVDGSAAAGERFLSKGNKWVTLASMQVTYGMMTSTVLGLGKLFSNVTQSIGANAVSETTSRTYGVQKNSSNQLVVNVPWSDTTVANTNTQNQYAVSAADGTNTSREKIVLTGSGHNGATTDFVEIGAGTGLSVARSGDVITLTNTVVNTNTTYSALTNTTLGLAKTAHAALNNTSLASVGESAAGRVYGIQKNTANQLVVQVPWANTNTNTQATYTLPVAAGAGNTAIINLTGGGAASGVASAVTFSGTTNEVAITESTGNNGTITIGLPDDVTIGNDLTVTNDALVSGDLVVTGSLDVNGTVTTLDSVNTTIKDNIIVLNSGQTNAFGGTSGIEIERGSTLPHAQVLWNDATNKWTASIGNTSLSMGNIFQDLFSTVTGDTGTASANSLTTALAVTGANGITTSATGQAVTVSGGSLTQGTVATLAASSMSSNLTANVTHALATKDVVVRTYLVNGDDYDEIYTDVKVVSNSVVRLVFSATPSANVRVVITAVRTPLAGTSVAYA
tara:strand:+ start:12 stop:1949 length:1938 start_codon:yes stop_codon:yes gene_type:complete